jgi:hypothetical protein
MEKKNDYLSSELFFPDENDDRPNKPRVIEKLGDLNDFYERYLPNDDKPKRKNKSPEHEIQVRVVKLLKSMPSQPLFSSTVGGVKVALHTARRMKEAGYNKGIPDMLIFEPKGDYIGLAIEIKAPKGKASAEQVWWVDNLRNRGWKALICRGYEECEQEIKKYFQ